MDPYPYSKSKWMDDYMDFDQGMSEEEIYIMTEKMLNSPAYLNNVITSLNKKIERLEDEIDSLEDRLNATLIVKIKWKIASLINRLPKIRIEW